MARRKAAQSSERRISTISSSASPSSIDPSASVFVIVGAVRLYLCAIKAVYSTRIVCYSIDLRMTSRIAVNALNSAVARRGEVARCILHTDRGFRSRKLVRALGRPAMVGSMGRVGASGDNAAMENSFSLLQKSVLNEQPRATREELRIGDRGLDREDLPPPPQTGLARPIDPIEFETIMTAPATQAA